MLNNKKSGRADVSTISYIQNNFKSFVRDLSSNYSQQFAPFPLYNAIFGQTKGAIFKSFFKTMVMTSDGLVKMFEGDVGECLYQG